MDSWRRKQNHLFSVSTAAASYTIVPKNMRLPVCCGGGGGGRALVSLSRKPCPGPSCQHHRGPHCSMQPEPPAHPHWDLPAARQARPYSGPPPLRLSPHSHSHSRSSLSSFLRCQPPEQGRRQDHHITSHHTMTTRKGGPLETPPGGSSRALCVSRIFSAKSYRRNPSRNLDGAGRGLSVWSVHFKVEMGWWNCSKIFSHRGSYPGREDHGPA